MQTVSAAVSIQALMRRCIGLKRLRPSLAARMIHLRAARCLVQSWRMSVLSNRLRMLSQACASLAWRAKVYGWRIGTHESACERVCVCTCVHVIFACV